MSNFIKEIADIEQEAVIDPPKDELNPDIFDGFHLKRRVRKSMLNLFKFLIGKIPLKNLDEFILEKNFVGSMTSFQWSEDSDVDLHIVIDDHALAEQHNMSSVEILEMLRNITKQYNKRFYIAGYEIEFYVQSKDEPFYSNGVYDVEYDAWSKSPIKEEYDKEKIIEAKKLAKDYKKFIMVKIKSILKDAKKYAKNREDESLIKKVKDHLQFIEQERTSLRDERNDAIRTMGDASIPNMKFKFLQRMKVLEKLKSVQQELEAVLFEIVNKRGIK